MNWGGVIKNLGRSALALTLLLSLPAYGQVGAPGMSGVNPGTAAGSGGGGGGSPGGTNGQVQYNNNGSFGGFTVGGFLSTTSNTLNVVTGTSGAAIPLLNGANTFSGADTFSSS